jgi:hypothetical protein
MRFLVAVAAVSMASSPALAMESGVILGAVPPTDVVSAASSLRISGVASENGAGAPDGSVPLLAPSSPSVLAQAAPRYVAADDERQRTCVAQAVYYESKGEPLRGQHAVADVVLNRTRRPGFASTPCGVIRQPHQFANAARWGIPSAADPLWQRAVEVARAAMAGVGTVSQVITRFHAARVNPGWGLPRVAAIGGHVFY